MIKVYLFEGGKMGSLARGVLEQHPNVELVDTGEYDVVFSASYPMKISQAVCRRAFIGAFNIHTGLLPEGRGSHPLNWALIWGKEKTGITIHDITDTFDGGDIIVQHEVPIFETDTIRTLRARVEAFFPTVISAFFDEPGWFVMRKIKQDQALASYAQKRRPEDSELNLSAPESHIYNLWRSCDPDEYPAFIMVNGRKCVVTDMVMEKGKIRYRVEGR